MLGLIIKSGEPVDKAIYIDDNEMSKKRLQQLEKLLEENKNKIKKLEEMRKSHWILIFLVLMLLLLILFFCYEILSIFSIFDYLLNSLKYLGY